MIAGHKGEIPFFILILPFLAGIISGLYLAPASCLPFLQLLLLTLGSAFIILNLLYRKLKVYKQQWTGGLLIHIIQFLLGVVIAIGNNELNHPDHFSKKRADFFAVKINNEPKLNNGLLRFTAAVEYDVLKKNRTPASGTLLITIKDTAALHLYYGDELLIPANYNAVEPPYNPAEFNYKKYLANQNIHYQAFLYPGQYAVLNKDAGNPIIAYSLRLRQNLVEKFKRNMQSPEAIAVASTLILGYKADLSKDVLQAYSKTGTIHVLSVSGAHVAIIFYLLTLLLGSLDRFRHGKLIRTALIILLIWFYSLLTGFSPAVCRAAFMISMIIIGKTYNRNINTLNILAVSAFFLLLYNPLYITDVGFQLSYLAVGGLIIFQPIVYRLFDFENKWADKLWLLCSASIAAQVITFPLSAMYFHQFPVYFLISNLFIIIPSMVIMYAGVGYLLLGWIPFLGRILGFILEKSILIMDRVLAIIEYAPFAGINKIWLTGTECLLLYGVIISAFYFLYNKKKLPVQMGLGCMLAFSLSISIKQFRALQSQNITFLSLKKHTGIVFRAGQQAAVFSDLSDTSKAYKYSIQPYLDSCQVSTVKVYPPDSTVNLRYLLAKSNLFTLGNKTMLIYGKDSQNIALPTRLKIDYLYIDGNPEADLALINKSYDFGMLIIGANNANVVLTMLKAESAKLGIRYTVHLRNKSLVLVSN